MELRSKQIVKKRPADKPTTPRPTKKGNFKYDFYRTNSNIFVVHAALSSSVTETEISSQAETSAG